MCVGVRACLGVHALSCLTLPISFAAFFVLIHVLALLKAVCKCTLRKTNDIWMKSAPTRYINERMENSSRLFALALNSSPSFASSTSSYPLRWTDGTALGFFFSVKCVKLCVIVWTSVSAQRFVYILVFIFKRLFLYKCWMYTAYSCTSYA